MSCPPARAIVQIPLDTLRTAFADLAFELERQGRRDAADVVMILDARVREMADAGGDEPMPAPAARIAEIRRGGYLSP